MSEAERLLRVALISRLLEHADKLDEALGKEMARNTSGLLRQAADELAKDVTPV